MFSTLWSCFSDLSGDAGYSNVTLQMVLMFLMLHDDAGDDDKPGDAADFERSVLCKSASDEVTTSSDVTAAATSTNTQGTETRARNVSGNASCASDTNCADDDKSAGDISCAGDVKSAGDVSCSDDVSCAGDVSCSGDVSCANDVSCADDTKSAGDISCAGDVSCADDGKSAGDVSCTNDVSCSDEGGLFAFIKALFPSSWSRNVDGQNT